MKKAERNMKPIHKFAKLPMQATLAGMIVASPMALAAEPNKTEQGETVLAPVEVTGTKQAAPIRSYNPQVTTVGRVATAQRDIPQTVTVVSAKLIDDQHATSMKEALRNVAGLTFNAGEGGRTGDNVTIRGFSAATDLYLDGVRDIGQYNRDLFNTERVEILKGPASMLFGRGSTGGVVNQVSKTPYAGQERDLSVSVGSYDSYRVEADLNQQIDATTAARLNVMGAKANSFRDEVETERWGIAPSFVMGLGQPTQLTLSWLYMQEDNIPDFGVPFQNGKPLEVPKERFYGLSEIDYEKNTTSVVTSVLQHKFSQNLNVRNTTRYGRYDRDLAPSAPRLRSDDACGAVIERPCMTRGRPMRVAEDTIVSNQFDVIAKAQTGRVAHDVLTGFELGKESSDSNRWNHPRGSVPATTTGNPDPHNLSAEPLRRETQAINFSSTTVGVYFQDLMALNDQWKLLAGLRWDRFSGDYFRKQIDYPQPADVPLEPKYFDFARKDYIWSYRTGLIYQPSDNSAYYASLGTSFNPSGEAYALDKSSERLPPEKNRNIEVGAKWDWFNGDLSVRTALFRSVKTNERNTDSANADVSALSGERHTDGFELEVSGRVTSNWEVFSGLTYLDAKVDKASLDQEMAQGKRPMNTPNYTANLWTTYRVAEAWRIGGGVNAVGRRYANANNSNELPAYAVWDAMASYEQEQYDVQLNFYNIFDKKYYEGQYPGHATYGKARSAVVTLNYHF